MWKLTISEKEIGSFNFNIKKLVTDSIKAANEWLTANGYITIDKFIDGEVIVKTGLGPLAYVTIHKAVTA